MRSGILKLGTVCVLILAIIFVSAYTCAANLKGGKKYKADELIIKFKDSVSEDARENIHGKHGSKKIKEFRSLRMHRVKIKEGLSVEEAIERHRAATEVEYAEPNYVLGIQAFPYDIRFDELWGLYNTGQTGGTPGADIDVPGAWGFSTGASDVVIAVIDTGVDYTHEDLAANMWVNEAEYSGLAGVDDDNNGYIDDIYGIDACNGDTDPMDDHGHGTHVSGTIGAIGNNSVGVVGVNWKVKIMSCKFLDATGLGYVDGAIECLEYIRSMKERGVNIVATNNTWGSVAGATYSQALYDAIHAQREILFVAAAGNSTADNDISMPYPAGYDLPNIIAVAATDHDDNLAYFSNYGRQTVHVGAPGVDVLSTLPQNSYAAWSGTSMAAAHVSGLAALMQAQDSSRNWLQIKNLILSSGDTVPALEGKTITGKRINAYGSSSCINNSLFSVLKHPATFEVGVPAVLSALSINCEEPAWPVTVTTPDGDVIELTDDGIGPDLAAGDGIFTGTWTPSGVTESLTFCSSVGTEIIEPVFITGAESIASGTAGSAGGQVSETASDKSKKGEAAGSGWSGDASDKSGASDQDTADDESGAEEDKKASTGGSGTPGVLGPGWHDTQGHAVSPAEARAYYDAKERENAALGIPAVTALAATTLTPEFSELARGLRYDPKLIYDYVHNHIDYVPYHGSLKGATLTYLDGSGNDFDQASLMIALLRASGYTAQYVYGTMTIPGSQMANWLGVDQTWQAVGNVLSSGGIPMNIYADATAIMDRVWVKAAINGQNYLFDPAFKSYTYTGKIDIGAAMGYSQADFLAAATAGAIVGADYVQNLNEANLRSKLSTYASNLASVIRSQHPNHNVKEIIGGRSIVQGNLTEYTSSLPFSPITGATWDEAPSAYTATLRIQHVGIDYTFQIPDLGGKRLTLTYAAGDYHPELRLDGSLIASGTATTPGSKNNCIIAINHPYAANSGTYIDQTVTYTPESGSTYAIVSNFGGISDALLQKRQEELDIYLAQGLSDASEAVLGETLNVMGQTWLKEVSMANYLLSALAETVSILHHNVGLMAQEAGYYIDVKACMTSINSKHNVDTDRKVHFKMLSLTGSALEHGILEQLMGTDSPGVSTMKLFQIANATGRKVFRADSSNYDTGGNPIRPQLQNYSTAELDDFHVQAVHNGYTLILPDNGQLVLGQWKGEGYISQKFTTTSMSMGMIIGGGYYGGYNSTPGDADPYQVSNVTQNNIVSNPTPGTRVQQVSTPATTPSTSLEPVDMASGAYLYDSTDLALGGGSPLGLAFTRSYASSLNREKRTLGYGWTHNYDIYVTESSHGEPGMGRRQPVDAAAMIAALYASLDLIKTQDTIQAWVTASLAAKWTVDQVIENAVTIHFGKKVMEFIRLADGTYASPPGITTQLTKSGDGTYILSERFGTRMNFGTNKRISGLTDVDGNFMAFAHSGDNLSTVQDAFGRTLTFGYTGDQITSVSDSAGRSVSYGYDASGNLTSYTDPEGKVWGYGYDTNHRMTSLSNPLTITTATNTYDSLDRVKTQTVPRQGGGAATYNFYFSGYRNVEEDPAGQTLTYFYDHKGREFAQKDALGNLVTKEFDGQDHLVLLTDPRSNSTSYLYDGQHNVTQITNALNYTMFNAYDTQHRLTDVTDPLAHTTHFGYDSKHHLIQTTDAAGNITGATYYANGFRYTATDARDTTATFAYDLYGSPQRQQTGSHPPITFSYDPIGRMTGLTDQAGAATNFVYDKRGLPISKTDPLGKTTGLTYDAAGRLSTRTDRNNNIITYGYSPSGNVETITYPDASTVSFTYNNLDQIVGMQDALGATGYGYDAAGRLTSVTDPHGFVVSYAYDEAGNLVTLTYPGNKAVAYTYDALNRLKTVTNWLNQTATYNYDGAGRLASFTNFNGVVTTCGYDVANRLTSVSSPVASYNFTLDGNGNRTNIVETEPLAPIVAAANIAYTYNTPKNRLLSAGGASFSYDNEGQLYSGYGSTYAFDYEHRLISIGTSTEFYYDGSGRRLEAMRSGVTTRYIYDAAGNLLAEADGANNITRYYIHGLGLLAMVTPSNEIYCYHYNATGSTIAMTDSSQIMVNKYAYDPFGKVTNQEETVSQPFKFVGQYGVMTEPNGFYYMRARYYDPSVGRFISEDPIGFEGGDVNLYAYVGNNPVNLIDPLGLSDMIFDPSSGTLTVIDKNGNVIGQYPAGNITDSRSKGPFPSGTFPVGGVYSNTGDRADRVPSQGPYFIHIKDVPDRSEMGVHGGRKGPQSPTMGCIRVHNDDLLKIVDIHRQDPLKTLAVGSGYMSTGSSGK